MDFVKGKEDTIPFKKTVILLCMYNINKKYYKKHNRYTYMHKYGSITIIHISKDGNNNGYSRTVENTGNDTYL